MRPNLGKLRKELKGRPNHSVGIIINPALPKPDDWGSKPEHKYRSVKGVRVWGASNAHIRGGIAVWVECDGSLSLEKQAELPKKLGLPPTTLTVKTGGKSLHQYWLMKEGEYLPPNIFTT